MDRRYLAATLAIVATFAVFSRGLRSGELKTLVCRGYSTMMQRFGDSSRMIGKVRVHLRPSQPEEAQMLAEMNLPMVRDQAQAAALMARQNAQAARCAREQALREAAQARREAERVQREAMRMQHDIAAAISARPIIVKVSPPDGIPRQIHLQVPEVVTPGGGSYEVDFTTEQLARLNEAAAQLAEAQLHGADLASQAPAGAEGTGCSGSRSWSRRVQAQYGSAMRTAIHAIQNSVNSKNATKSAVKTGGYL